MSQEKKSIKILVSEPMAGDKPEPHWAWYDKTLKLVIRPETSIDFVHLKKAYRSLSPYTSAYNSISMIQRAYEADKKGYDAFVIGCATDLGLKESRAIVNIPVVAPTESAVYFAATLGNKFSIIAVNPNGCVLMENLVKGYGLREKLASIRPVPGLTLAKNFEMMLGGEQDKLIKMITQEMAKAVKEDGAESLFVPCVPTASMLTMNGIYNVEGAPVIDLLSISIKQAETMVELKRGYGTSVCKRSIYIPPYPGWEQDIPIVVD